MFTQLTWLLLSSLVGILSKRTTGWSRFHDFEQHHPWTKCITAFCRCFSQKTYMMHCVFKLITLYSILSAFGSKSDKRSWRHFEVPGTWVGRGCFVMFFLVTGFDSLEMVHHPRMARVHRLKRYCPSSEARVHGLVGKKGWQSKDWCRDGPSSDGASPRTREKGKGRQSKDWWWDGPSSYGASLRTREGKGVTV